MPGYVLVNPFVQVRPVDRLTLALNVNNLFDAKGISTVMSAAVPASGVTSVTVINGRTISASARFDF